VVLNAQSCSEHVNSNPEVRLHVDIIVKYCTDSDYLVRVTLIRRIYIEWYSACVVVVAKPNVLCIKSYTK